MRFIKIHMSSTYIQLKRLKSRQLLVRLLFSSVCLSLCVCVAVLGNTRSLRSTFSTTPAPFNPQQAPWSPPISRRRAPIPRDAQQQPSGLPPWASAAAALRSLATAATSVCRRPLRSAGGAPQSPPSGPPPRASAAGVPRNRHHERPRTHRCERPDPLPWRKWFPPYILHLRPRGRSWPLPPYTASHWRSSRRSSGRASLSGWPCGRWRSTARTSSSESGHPRAWPSHQTRVPVLLSWIWEWRVLTSTPVVDDDPIVDDDDEASTV